MKNVNIINKKLRLNNKLVNVIKVSHITYRILSAKYPVNCADRKLHFCRLQTINPHIDNVQQVNSNIYTIQRVIFETQQDFAKKYMKFQIIYTSIKYISI